MCLVFSKISFKFRIWLALHLFTPKVNLHDLRNDFKISVQPWSVLLFLDYHIIPSINLDLLHIQLVCSILARLTTLALRAFGRHFVLACDGICVHFRTPRYLMMLSHVTGISCDLSFRLVECLWCMIILSFSSNLDFVFWSWMIWFSYCFGKISLCFDST